MIGGPDAPLRLLPWSTPEGKPCYLRGDGDGPVSRIADDIERVQLTMADELLGHADDMLNDTTVTAPQLRYLAVRMTEALRDVRRVAESRGARIPVLADTDPDEEPDDGENDGENDGEEEGADSEAAAAPGAD